MSQDPVLVLQLQRMGDLILSFPLLTKLRKLHPGHPLWVVAEPHFFQELMPLAPEAVFFPPAHCTVLAKGRYKLAVNLSGRPEAAACMGTLTSEQKFGPVAQADGLRVHGYWHLYRAALTQNNHGNAFHWSDLFLLDQEARVNLGQMGHARPKAAGNRRVGLVLGASEEAKRPPVDFWARLARRLAGQGLTPLFLGGTAEADMAREVSRRSGLIGANFCGRPLHETAALMRSLDLCISPDTGPMHLASWLGVPTLNLSMGPVHARETGPASPGHWVLRAALSCVGCWQCQRNKYYCRQAFTPAVVSRVALALLDASAHASAHNVDAIRSALLPQGLPSLSLHYVERDSLGLHKLTCIIGNTSSCRPVLENFSQAVFLSWYDKNLQGLALDQAQTLRTAFPMLAEHLAVGTARLCLACAHLLKSGGALPANFWKTQPPLMRLFTGHIQMTLQNTDYSTAELRAALERLESLRYLLTR